MQPSLVVAVAVAGGAGVVLRHVLGAAVATAWPHLPLATALVNVAGCLGFGLCYGIGHGRWSPVASAAVFAGLFGGFTTFSAFAFECHELWAAKRWTVLALDVVGQNVLGVLAMAAGIAAGSWLQRG